MDWLKEYWFLIWAGILTVVQVGNMLLTKTFARKEDVDKVVRDVDELKAKIDHLPTGEEVSRLRIELETTRGELKALQPQLDQVRNLTQLLLEQQLDK